MYETEAWHRLGIEPTSDLKVIKRAYAKQLKCCRPDEDPEGFQALRSAFDIAKDSVREQRPIEIPGVSLQDAYQPPFDPNTSLKQPPEWQPLPHYEAEDDKTREENWERILPQKPLKQFEMPEEPALSVEPEPETEHQAPHEQIPEPTPEPQPSIEPLQEPKPPVETPSEPTNLAIEPEPEPVPLPLPDITGLEQHTHDPHQYCSLLLERIENIDPFLPETLLRHHWNKILANDGLWRIETKQLFSDYLFEYLIENQVQRPCVWKLLAQHFPWQTQAFSLCERFNQSDVEDILDRLEGNPRKTKEPSQAFDYPNPSKEKGKGSRWPYYLLLFFTYLAIKALFMDTPSHTISKDDYYTPNYDPAGDSFNAGELDASKFTPEKTAPKTPGLPIKATGNGKEMSCQADSTTGQIICQGRI
ncbi:MAG: hypothetical protein HN790_11420 [Methylococcales bacterium]|jgi:hypothetical protein|nr:hypothetical protein [Methylococcales bacterium]